MGKSADSVRPVARMIPFASTPCRTRHPGPRWSRRRGRWSSVPYIPRRVTGPAGAELRHKSVAGEAVGRRMASVGVAGGGEVVGIGIAGRSDEVAGGVHGDAVPFFVAATSQEAAVNQRVRAALCGIEDAHEGVGSSPQVGLEGVGGDRKLIPPSPPELVVPVTYTKPGASVATLLPLLLSSVNPDPSCPLRPSRSSNAGCRSDQTLSPSSLSLRCTCPGRRSGGEYRPDPSEVVTPATATPPSGRTATPTPMVCLLPPK